MNSMTNSNRPRVSPVESSLPKTTESLAKDFTLPSRESEKDITIHCGNRSGKRYNSGLHLYTDGSSARTGTWGWAWVLVDPFSNTQITSGSGAGASGTCNVAELTACLRGLQAIPSCGFMTGTPVYVHSDSAYLVNCFNDKWFVKWQANGWKTNRAPVKNAEIWRELIDVVSKMDVQFIHVPAHRGIEWNEWCDTAAKAARYELESTLDGAV